MEITSNGTSKYVDKGSRILRSTIQTKKRFHVTNTFAAKKESDVPNSQRLSKNNINMKGYSNFDLPNKNDHQSV